MTDKKKATTERPARRVRSARVAILGAGSTGTCAALELAGRGLRVDLIDENDTPVRRASFHNEGKIHLGLLYAKDASLRTAEMMMRGALTFAPLLDRWVGFDGAREVLSTPFVYAVHRGTMVDVDSLKAHYARCARLFDELRTHLGAAYLGGDRSLRCEEIPRAEQAAIGSTVHFLTMFRTNERAVDPRPVAARLSAAALAHPNIRFIPRARVHRVTNHRGLRVCFEQDGAPHVERYDQVANTLWHGRLEIDATMRVAPPHPWSHRYKFANRVRVPLDATIPSITCVLGPFGDIVNFGENGLFLSWYPTGMIGTSHALRPPEWERDLSPAMRMEVFRKSLAEWRARCPALASLVFDEREVDPGGGVIFAWGDTGVDDQKSMLHERHEIGVHSVGRYHSVNTGKYTMTPYMGMRTAERILGIA